MKINVKDYGAVPIARNGPMQDSTVAFRRAVDAVLGTAEYPRKDFTARDSEGKTVRGVLKNERTIKNGLFIPAGDYLITDPAVFMTRDLAGNIRGYDIEGEAMASTRIIYRPKEKGPLFDIAGSLMFGKISNVSFFTDDPTAQFWKSEATRGCQGFVFDRVEWGGSWKHCFNLLNTHDNNSELTFRDCRMTLNEEAESFLFSDGTDQQVGYLFDGCHFWGKACWLDMYKGGNVAIHGGSIIISNNRKSVLDVFRLRAPRPHRNHNDGVENFAIRDLRVEFRDENIRLINCDWSRGMVLLDNLNTDSMDFKTRSHETLRFGFGNRTGPIVKICNSTLTGFMSVAHAGRGHPSSRIKIQDSTFTQELEQDYARMPARSLVEPQLIGCRTRTKPQFTDAR